MQLTMLLQTTAKRCPNLLPPPPPPPPLTKKNAWYRRSIEKVLFSMLNENQQFHLQDMFSQTYTIFSYRSSLITTISVKARCDRRTMRREKKNSMNNS